MSGEAVTEDKVKLMILEAMQDCPNGTRTDGVVAQLAKDLKDHKKDYEDNKTDVADKVSAAARGCHSRIDAVYIWLLGTATALGIQFFFSLLSTFKHTPK